SGRALVDMISMGPSPLEFDLTPNWHVLSFSSAVAIATALLFGLVPALQITATGPNPALKEDLRVGSARSRWLRGLVSAQVALSLVLLAGAGLFVRTLYNLQRLDPGFNQEGVLVVDLDEHRTPIPPELDDDVRRLPGVLAAGLSTHTPLNGWVW